MYIIQMLIIDPHCDSKRKRKKKSILSDCVGSRGEALVAEIFEVFQHSNSRFFVAN